MFSRMTLSFSAFHSTMERTFRLSTKKMKIFRGKLSTGKVSLISCTLFQHTVERFCTSVVKCISWFLREISHLWRNFPTSVQAGNVILHVLAHGKLHFRPVHWLENSLKFEISQKPKKLMSYPVGLILLFIHRFPAIFDDFLDS